MSTEKLVDLLRPVLDHLKGLDLSDAEAARQSLNKAFPVDSALVAAARGLFREGIEQGWLCDKGGGGARFSRVAKAGDATHGFSIDAVRLDGPGVWHRHTTGEVDLCFAEGPEARFDGFPDGWAVLAPGTDHVPTTTGGVMNILYFIPQGALQWTKEG